MAIQRKTSEVVVDMRKDNPAKYATITEIRPRTFPFLYAPMMERINRIVGRTMKRKWIAGSE